MTQNRVTEVVSTRGENFFFLLFFSYCSPFLCKGWWRVCSVWPGSTSPPSSSSMRLTPCVAPEVRMRAKPPVGLRQSSWSRCRVRMKDFSVCVCVCVCVRVCQTPNCVFIRQFICMYMLSSLWVSLCVDQCICLLNFTSVYAFCVIP